MNPEHKVSEIKQIAKECGYIDCGIASTEPFIKFARAIDKRIEQFPEAAGHYKKLRQRAFPRKHNPWAESLVVGVRWYGKYKIPENISSGIGRNYLFDRRYKHCPENNMPRLMKAELKKLGLRVKNGGIPERWAAARSGVARFGRNNFVYREKEGSWINIESWIVDEKLPADEPSYEPPCPDSCQLCVKECPTNALKEPFCMRMDHCAAYLSYSAPEPIEEPLWSQMGKWIYGCDECQLVCPLNKGKWRQCEPAPWIEEAAHYLTTEALANMDDNTFRNIVQPLFWYISPENAQRWLKNARRALAHDK